MNNSAGLFDIIGPVIVGPSSSHTAGAVRIGLLSRKIYGKEPKKIRFTLYNSYSKTGIGHGSDKGLLAGIMGLDVDNSDIKNAFKIADEKKISYEFLHKQDFSQHPNFVEIEFISTKNDKPLKISAKSIGAGEVRVTEINGYSFNLSGEYYTLILMYKDKPGIVSEVTEIIKDEDVNIASMHVDRTEKGKEASMGLCLDSNLSKNIMEKLTKNKNIHTVRLIEPLKK